MEVYLFTNVDTVELQRLEHIWAHENMFETGAVRARGVGRGEAGGGGGQHTLCPPPPILHPHFPSMSL